MDDSATEKRYSRTEVEQLLDIKKDLYYKWLKYLGIQPHKDSGGRTYLIESEIEQFFDLKEYYEENGKIEGFLEINGIVKVEPESSLEAVPDLEIPDSEPFNPDAERLLAEAAELKARQIMMPDLVRLHLAEQMAEEDLPDYLRDRVKAAREAANPTSTPAEIASRMLTQYRGRRKLK